MANETITDDIVRDFFQENKIYQDGKIIIERQSTKNKKIDKLLANASKSGCGKGYPDILIQYKENPDLLIVIENKAESKNHGENKNKHSKYAIDGVLLYSAFLSKEYDVLSIAISGETIESLKVSHFLQLKNTVESYSIFKDDKLLDLEIYQKGFETDERKFNQDFQELLKYSKTLNDSLHNLKVKEHERSLFISGTLIALTDKAFCNSYKLKEPKSLAKLLISTIEEKLNIVQNKPVVVDVISSYSFITTHTILSKEADALKNIVEEIDKKINNFIQTYKYYDVLGQFYIEFLRYANNDNSLGIVLTPPHITEIFTEIANINKDSVVLDTCTGTGGFLISSMRKMIKDAGGDLDKEYKIKDEQIIGVEMQHDIFSLVCSNMYIHGDGRSNLIKGKCFDSDVKNKISEYKPNTGFLNPPYKTSKNDDAEFKFILNNLEQLEKRSLCVAIIPTSCVLADRGEDLHFKKMLLKNHTLEAVFSMPNELFYNSKVAVATCVIVLKAKEKHPNNYKTYFALWRNDGFTKIKNLGRVDYNNKWNKIKEYWLNNYKNKDEITGHSVKKVIAYKDEWIAENYIKVDYSTVNKKDFENFIFKYVGNLFILRKIDIIGKKCKKEIDLTLKEKEFKYFNLTGKNGIFNIEKGERLNKNKRVEGDMPFLTSTALNNGISNFIDYDTFIDEKRINKNKITIDMLSNVFYHGYKYFSDDNIHTLALQEEYTKYDNKYISIFIATLLNKISVKFNYGRQVRLKRLQRETVALPIDKNNQPDWQFMEDYIKSLPYSKSL